MEESTKYSDMWRRVRQHAPCPVEFWDGMRGCWPYGTLFLTLDGEVTFGDLTVQCDMAQVLNLIALATVGQARHDVI